MITENKYPILEFDENKNLSSQAYAHVFSGNFAADCVKNPWRATARLRIFALSATKLCSKIYNEKFLELIRAFDHQNKPVAFVCVAALPIAKSGVLKNRKATTYHLNGALRQKQLAKFEVNVVNERVVIDDNIITTFCPETAPDAAFELLRKLVGDEKMLTVKHAMGF
ncbi:MAG: DJ-1/PfpI family protein [Oscillospiraceae bacterium]|nr:DJ-1/PfpI family protein [Oscillospiraceae bacterium]MDY3793182.1 DJ-1/PfpI family protein [Oscillospiraceae bacterium]MDY6207519.1 DJ-1/PfpI family protein [Oscillospiraceae bacterium]